MSAGTWGVHFSGGAEFCFTWDRSSGKNNLVFYLYYRRSVVDISRRLGIMVFMAMPAIFGGGIVYHFFGNYTSVIIYEGLLLLTALGFMSK